MIKKILINIIIIIMISTLSTYATEVPEPETLPEPVQTENKEEVPKEEGSEDKDNKDNGTNTNNKDENNSNTNTSSNKGTSNKTNTNKGQSKPKKDIDTTAKPKSKDANLKELKIDKEGMTPEFDKDVTEYYLTTDLKVEQITVTATPSDEKAKVTVTGNKKLKEGKNIITITVKAEDGTNKKYYIYVTKVDDVEKANADLKSLEITNYDLSPKFKANIYQYNLNIGEDIQTLEIKAEAEKENAKVEIEGNSNLQEGENIIKIKVTAEDGETVRTYKINTYISSKKVEVEKESKLPAIILLIVTGSGIIVLGLFLIKKKMD